MRLTARTAGFSTNILTSTKNCPILESVSENSRTAIRNERKHFRQPISYSSNYI